MCSQVILEGIILSTSPSAPPSYSKPDYRSTWKHHISSIFTHNPYFIGAQQTWEGRAEGCSPPASSHPPLTAFVCFGCDAAVEGYSTERVLHTSTALKIDLAGFLRHRRRILSSLPHTATPPPPPLSKPPVRGRDCLYVHGSMEQFLFFRTCITTLLT